ncbi:MAG TPA: hypothetical protein VNO56_03730 [Gaiellaceae bacterium]|nr:hypothetical protein [Gaiellaceae bacterium]
MASKKQRRKREKLQRHEYEYVLETEEGEEIPLESPRGTERARNGKAPAKESGQPLDRRGRPVQKPSLQRVLKRSAIFAPLIAAFILFTTDNVTVPGLIFNVVLLLAFFMPFTYFVDLFVYRMLMRRLERERGQKPS